MLIPEDVKIYLYTQPTDMRKSIDTLCIMVSEILKMDPISGHLFLFRNRSGNKLKALYYELIALLCGIGVSRKDALYSKRMQKAPLR
jgi:transposase